MSSVLQQLPCADTNRFIYSYPNNISKQLVNVYQKQKNVDSPGVYMIPCNQCNEIYLGQSGRDLPTRIREHKNAVRYAQTNSAVFNHVNNMNHTINWTEANLLYKSHCSFRRKIVE